LLATGNWLLATGCWQLAAGYWQLAAGYWQLAAGYWLLGEKITLSKILFKTTDNLGKGVKASHQPQVASRFFK